MTTSNLGGNQPPISVLQSAQRFAAKVAGFGKTLCDAIPETARGKFADRKFMFLTSLVFVIVASFFTHFHAYKNPQHFFWDENYHTASAYKYLNRVFFMEPHPALGKLFIALGEYLYNHTSLLDVFDEKINENYTPEVKENLKKKNAAVWYKLSTNKKDKKDKKEDKNPATDKEDKTDEDDTYKITVLTELTTLSYVKSVPTDFKFIGLRFFPSLFGWWCVPLFFLILFQVSGRPLLSLAFTSLYAFENSMILHFRSAMLDSIQIFFILIAVSYFLHLFKAHAEAKWWQYMLWGAIISLAISTKVTGAIVAFLFPFLCFKNFDFGYYLADWKKQAYRIFVGGASFFVGLVVPFIGLLYLHYALAATVDSSGNWYEVSSDMREVVASGNTADIRNIPLYMKESLRFTKKYNKGVPSLDVCKKDENGSSPVTWPFGGKSISYSWKKDQHCNYKGTAYFYLQVNPLIISITFFGLMFAFILIGGKLFYGLQITDKGAFKYMLMFLSLYLVYMIAVFNIDRVMYFYHYFIPYTFAMMITYCMFIYSFKEYADKRDVLVWLAILFFVVQIFAVYLFYSPFIYADCITAEEFYKRVWFKLWKLSPVI